MEDLLTKFNIDFCKTKSPELLKKIYNSEKQEVIDELIKVCFPDSLKKQKKVKEE